MSCFFLGYCDHRDLHVLTHSFPTRRSSDLYCAFYAILSVVAVSWLRKSTRMGVKSILAAFELGAKGVVLVAIATAAAGMIVGVFELTTVEDRKSTRLNSSH